MLTNATMWMHLENILLSAKSRSQKSMYCVIAFIWTVQNRQTLETESRLKVARAFGDKGINEGQLKVTRFLLGVMKRF